ncbi:MAG: hypothetical protein ACI9DH_001549 [Halioglobus sp.]|jgi:hypothetical protein
MKAPPVPEVFGNYLLKDFSQIVLPQEISWIPQTLGWKCFAALLVILFTYYLLRKLRRHYQNRYRREGVARLRAIGNCDDSQTLVRELNQVLKLVAMVAYPRTAVASLSGQAWTGFLNQQCGAPVFNKQQKTFLASGSYQQIAIDKESAQDLVQASLAWIDGHRRAHDV